MGRLAALTALAAVLLGTSGASAYCRSSTCDPEGPQTEGSVCFPPQPTDCGIPLRWFRSCIGYAVQTDASIQVDRATTRSAMRAAFDTWEAARCGEGNPTMHAEDLKPVECDKVEYNKEAGNVNLVVFRDREWPHAESERLALTTVTFDPENGEIFDADIEINTFHHDFITPTAPGDFELLAVLTHEVGHVLGIAHSPLEEATMFASYSPESVTLAPDDEQAICSIYPPKAETGTCNPIPRHGFSSTCAGQQTEGDCSAAPPGTSRGYGLSALAALALGVALQRLRRGGSRTSLLFHRELEAIEIPPRPGRGIFSAGAS